MNTGLKLFILTHSNVNSLFFYNRYERKEADLLKSLNETEIEKEEETSTEQTHLIRGSTEKHFDPFLFFF